jgi:hypothetical protein
MGADLDLTGSGFTPFDGVLISAEGIIGMRDHHPTGLGAVITADKNGKFSHQNVTIRFAEVQPNNDFVVIRATDHHGISAVDTTGGFHNPDV